MDIPSLRISHDAANKWLYTQWLGEHDESSVRLHARYVYACLATQPCTKILSDHSLLVSRSRYTTGGSQQYFERLSQQGIRHFAWVYSPSYCNRQVMEKAMAHAKCPAVAIFDEVASAYDWLRRHF